MLRWASDRGALFTNDKWQHLNFGQSKYKACCAGSLYAKVNPRIELNQQSREIFLCFINLVGLICVIVKCCHLFAGSQKKFILLWN